MASLFGQPKSVSMSTEEQASYIKPVRIPQDQEVMFKIVPNFRHINENGEAHIFVKTFTHWLEYSIDGKKVFAVRTNRGKGDRISAVKNSIGKMAKDVSQMQVDNPAHRGLQALYTQEAEKVMDFLKAQCNYYVLGLVPNDPEIKLVQLKTTAKDAVEEAQRDLSQKDPNLSFWYLGVSPGELVPGWVIVGRTGTGRDTKYSARVAQVMNGSSAQIASFALHPSVYDIDVDTDEGMNRLPDIQKMQSSNYWPEEDDIKFASMFNFPTWEQVVQSGIPPDAHAMIAASYAALPRHIQDRHSGASNDSPAPQQVPQTHAQQPPAPQYAPQVAPQPAPAPVPQAAPQAAPQVAPQPAPAPVPQAAPQAAPTGIAQQAAPAPQSLPAGGQPMTEEQLEGLLGKPSH